MDALASDDVFLFDDFRLHRRAGGLFRRDEHGVFALVALGSRALDVLGVMIERAGDLVSRDELIAAVWPATVVEDNNLNMQIAALRRILDDRRRERSCIQTVPRRGYRFVAAVKRVAAGARLDSVAEFPQASGRSRLSIVVLPFANLSNDPEQQYLADGITEDLTSDLSRIVGMLVISRTTAFTYRYKPVDTKQIGRELGVRYAAEGSVQRLGKRIRVTAQLIDTETDSHLWAERFDRDAGDLFALQDEITRRIAVGLNLELVGAEAGRTTDHPDALDYILRGRATVRSRTHDNYVEAIRLFERALRLDPFSTEARCHLARALAGRVLDDMTGSPAADTEHAERLVSEALAQSPHDPQVHFAKGQVLRAQNRYSEAIDEYETVLAIDRNWVAAYAHLGRCKLVTGSIEELIPLHEQAILLSPRDPGLSTWYERIGQAHLVQSRIDESILWLERARSANPAFPINRAFLAATYALKGDMERATFELAEARRLSGTDRYSSIARVRTNGWLAMPDMQTLFEPTFFAGLRKAGLPEE